MVLVVYVAVMLLVASVVARLETARTEAHQHEEAIRRLFELTDLLIEDRPLSEILELIVSTVHEAFALRSVALLLPVDATLDVVASAGEPLSEAELRRVDAGARGPRQPGQLGSDARHEQAQTVALTATGPPHRAAPHLGCGPQPARPGPAAHLRQPHGARPRAGATTGTGAADRVARGGRSPAAGPRGCGLPRPAYSAGHHQGIGIHLAQRPRRRDPADREELLELIDNQTDRLDRLVTNLLDLSRVQAGALELRNQPIAVRRPRHRRPAWTGVTRTDVADITTAVDDDLPLVDVDHLLIGQVLANLLDNAIRHAPPHTADHGRRRDSRDDGLVQMAVEDKGPGVARAERTNVFRMFNRSGTSGGTGVGLSIAKAFVEAHGQEIWVEDAPTGGARFCFTMPPARVTVDVP